MGPELYSTKKWFVVVLQFVQILGKPNERFVIHQLLCPECRTDSNSFSELGHSAKFQPVELHLFCPTLKSHLNYFSKWVHNAECYLVQRNLFWHVCKTCQNYFSKYNFTAELYLIKLHLFSFWVLKHI